MERLEGRMDIHVDFFTLPRRQESIPDRERLETRRQNGETG
jgi:hypothetical protein